jgi:hypothetical protein
MLKVYVTPSQQNLPARGGVREHMIQLYKCINSDPEVEVSSIIPGSILHAESSFYPGYPPHVYACHGGFVPPPTMAPVDKALRTAKVVVSVAQWMVQKYMQHCAKRTVCIPNGVDLAEWENIPPSGLEPGYVLYGKEGSYYFDKLVQLIIGLPHIRFVTTIWLDNLGAPPANVTVIGLKSREEIRPFINDAGCLLMVGPEVCPTMVLEAWACRVPIVASNVCGSAELVGASGEGGVLYDTFSEAVNGILDCLAHRDELGKIGREKVEWRYQSKSIHAKFKRLWQACYDGTYKELVAEAQSSYGGWV